MKKHIKKILIGIGVLGVASAAIVIGISAVPCIDDTSKNINQRIETCSIQGIEKANFKSREIAKFNFAKYTDSATGITVEIKDGKITQIEGGIELYARAWRGVNQLGLGKDSTTEWEHFRIFNPPIMVDDPNGTIVRTWTDSLTKEIKTRKLREDPLAAIKNTLAHTIKVSSKEGTNIVKGSVGNTTSTFYPDADVESTSVDGVVGTANANDSWANKIAAAGGNVNDISASNVFFNFNSDNQPANTWFQVWRSIFLFDTSALGTGATIDSAVLSLFGTSKTDGSSSNPNLDIYTSTPASNTALVAADYSQVGSVSQTGSPITYANFSITAYNDFTLNATGIGNVSKTGISKFGGRNANYDVAATAPPWVAGSNNEMRGYFADEAGTANDPKLVVVHSGAAVAPVISPIIQFE